MPIRWTQTVVIPNAADGLSPAYEFGGGAKYMGLIMSAAWTAAGLSFQVGNTLAGTFYDLYTEAGAEVAIAAGPTAARTTSLDALLPYLSQFKFVKVRSGVTALPVQQAAPRTLTFIFER